MVKTVPFENHLSGRDVNLLDDSIDHFACSRTADGGKVSGHGVKNRDERRVFRSEQKFMAIGFEPVACMHGPYHLIFAIEDVIS